MGVVQYTLAAGTGDSEGYDSEKFSTITVIAGSCPRGELRNDQVWVSHGDVETKVAMSAGHSDPFHVSERMSCEMEFHYFSDIVSLLMPQFEAEGDMMTRRSGEGLKQFQIPISCVST